MKTMIVALTLLTISFAGLSQSSKSLLTRHDSIIALQQIIKNGRLSGSAVGFAGTPSRNWYSFVYLVSMAKPAELAAMTKSSNPALRVYAYAGLAYLKDKQAATAQQLLSADTAKVNTISGCIAEEMKVSDAISHLEMWQSPALLKDLIAKIRTDKKYSKNLFADLLANRPIKRETRAEKR